MTEVKCNSAIKIQRKFGRKLPNFRLSVRNAEAILLSSVCFVRDENS